MDPNPLHYMKHILKSVEALDHHDELRLSITDIANHFEKWLVHSSTDKRHDDAHHRIISDIVAAVPGCFVLKRNDLNPVIVISRC